MDRTGAFELYDLKITVQKDPNKPLICNHPEGSFFFLSGENIIFPEGTTFPIYSLAALIPILPVKQRLTHRNDWMTTDSHIACPDPNCGGVFLVTRLKLRTFYHEDVTAVPLAVGEGHESE